MSSLRLGPLIGARPEADPCGGSRRPSRDISAAGRGCHYRVGSVEQVAAVAPGGFEGYLPGANRLPRPGRGCVARPAALLVVAGEHRGGGAERESLDQRAL